MGANVLVEVCVFKRPLEERFLVFEHIIKKIYGDHCFDSILYYFCFLF